MNTPSLIYLAGPIDEVTQDNARNWRAEMEKEAPTGVVFFSPAHAYFNVNETNAQALDTANRHVINVADGLLAYLPEGSRGFGTIREIEFACRVNTPVVVVGSLKSLLVYDIQVVDDLEVGLLHLLEQIKEGREAVPFPFTLFRPPAEE